MSVLHTGTFIHVANMEQTLIPKQPTMCVCKAFISFLMMLGIWMPRSQHSAEMNGREPFQYMNEALHSKRA